MNILYISSSGKTDLYDLLSESGIRCELNAPKFLASCDISRYDGFIFDGTGAEKGLLFRPDERVAADTAAESGKPVIAIACPFISCVCCDGPVSTRFSRPVVSAALDCDGLSEGELLDEQCNARFRCYTSSKKIVPLLYYRDNPRGFYFTDPVRDPEPGTAAIWFESECLLMIGFGISNFASSRFSPKMKWYSLLRHICTGMFGADIGENAYRTMYAKRGYSVCREDGPIDSLLAESVRRAVDWHFASGSIIEDGYGIYAVSEGMTSEILPDGRQVPNRGTTVDSTGETAMMFRLHDDFTGKGEKTDYVKAFSKYALSHIRDYGGALDGYGSSGDGAWWNACYGDDVSRGILIPELFRVFKDGGKLPPEVIKGLDFLVSTTGTDGLRYCRTDITDKNTGVLSLFSLEKTDGKWHWGSAPARPAQELSLTEARTPSVHYNGYYLAALLLAYKVTGDKKYRDTAVKGLTTIMEVYYPETAREHSETEELCRLVLPLAYLYWVTKEEKHRKWLYTVLESLEEKQRPDGSFTEWDTGYIACCAGTAGTECSVLAENGDPVVDLLYSMNWLPSALAQAYFITGDNHIAELFESTSRFLISVQIRSSNPLIDGGWARAFDAEGQEVYGVTNDVGWAPWSIETGWTMAQIPTGFLMWLMRDRLMPLYK